MRKYFFKFDTTGYCGEGTTGRNYGVESNMRLKMAVLNIFNSSVES